MITNKKAIWVILHAIMDRQDQKKGRNLRTMRLIPEAKQFLQDAKFLTKEGHFYTKSLNLPNIAREYKASDTPEEK